MLRVQARGPAIDFRGRRGVGECRGRNGERHGQDQDTMLAIAVTYEYRYADTIPFYKWSGVTQEPVLVASAHCT